MTSTLSTSGSSYAMSSGGGGSRRVGSVYGGAGGSGVRVSRSVNSFSSMGGAGGAGGAMSQFDLGENKKIHMQNLNDRLSTYLQKVKSLEKENSDLELKIRQFLENKTKPEAHDYTAFFVRIRDLEGKIGFGARGNAALVLGIDNAKLAADDFKIKFENEQAMRLSVDADIVNLKKVLDELTLSRSDLELYVESLREELLMLKKTHKEDLLAFSAQLGGQVNVEVDAAPQQDLSAVMASIREHYENVAAKNAKDLDAWFTAKSAELSNEVAVSTLTLQTSKSEITEIRRLAQSLEIKLRAAISKKGALEATLAETQSRYSEMLSGYQRQVLALEEQLGLLRADLNSQKTQYSNLFDMKTRLELEIAEYRRLLEGELEPVKKTSTTTKTTRVVTIVQEVDEHGNIISTN